MAKLFNYTDFRKFLKDRIAALKEIDRSFTYRFIASGAGFRSPGYLTQVLQGKSNLSDRLIVPLAKVLKLKPREITYFGHMVRYNQADSHDTKKEFFRKMTGYKKGRVKTLSTELYEFYDKWYYSAIRAILQFSDFGGDYKRLSRMVIPNITPAEARKTVGILLRNGFLKETNDGRMVLTEKHISTGLDTDSVVINNFVINTLEIAKDAFYRFPRQKRSFSSLTLGISEVLYHKIKDRTDSFRREIVDLVGKDTNVDRVYQLNIQLFPLSDTEEGETT